MALMHFFYTRLFRSAMKARQAMCLCFLALLLVACSSSDGAKRSERVAHSGVYSASISPDASMIMVGSLNHGGSLWTRKPFGRTFDWNHKTNTKSNILSSAFSADGAFVATAEERTIVLWNTKTGEAVWFWNAPGAIEDIELTQQGDMALLGLKDSTAKLFDIKNGGVKATLRHDGTVYDVSLSDDGLTAASASDDNTARVWQLPSGKLAHTLKHRNQVRTAELSSDGKILFTSALSDDGIIWDAQSGKELARIGFTRGHYSSARFSTNKRWLLTGNAIGIIELWDVRSGDRKRRWKPASTKTFGTRSIMVKDVAFLGKYFLAVGADGQIHWLK